MMPKMMSKIILASFLESSLLLFLTLFFWHQILASFFDIILWRYFWHHFWNHFWHYFLTSFFDILFYIIFGFNIFVIIFDIIFWHHILASFFDIIFDKMMPKLCQKWCQTWHRINQCWDNPIPCLASFFLQCKLINSE